MARDKNLLIILTYCTVYYDEFIITLSYSLWQWLPIFKESTCNYFLRIGNFFCPFRQRLYVCTVHGWYVVILWTRELCLWEISSWVSATRSPQLCCKDRFLPNGQLIKACGILQVCIGEEITINFFAFKLLKSFLLTHWHFKCPRTPPVDQ